jgi:hypothetical protein
MMGRQARASVRVMRVWKPHDLGRSCLRCTIRHHVTNKTESQNDGALPAQQSHLYCEFFEVPKTGAGRPKYLSSSQIRTCTRY